MTDYTLPEGMTATGLRIMATNLKEGSSYALEHNAADRLNAWADAIDPPEPVSVVTDEMVEAVMGEVWGGDQAGMPAITRSVLEAAVKCGWAPPRDLESDADNPSSSDDERLEMAERLLRAVLVVSELRLYGRDGAGWWDTMPSSMATTPDEAEYLRSLNGEGE